MNKLKAWLRGVVRSWTMWFNSLLASVPVVMQSLPELQAYLPADIYKWLFLALVIGNILLRAKTNKSLSER